MGRLTFPNPAYQEAEKRGFYTGNIPQFIRGYEFTGSQIMVPRGFTRQLLIILRRAGISYQVNDQRRTLEEVDLTFRGELHDFQKQAVSAVMSRDFGVLAAPAGSGKTVMALALIALRRQPALVMVHTRELLEQWVERIGTFLGIPAREVGSSATARKA
jgi:superfamily II DNA or RNA helicase